MRRKLKIAAATGAGLIVVLLLGLSVWYYMGGLDEWFRRRLISDLRRMNICAEVAKAELGLRAGEVRIEGLVLRVCGDEEPFAVVDVLTAKVDIKDYYQQQFDLRELKLTRPRIVVRFDESGRSNLAGIKLPEEDTAESRRQLTWLAASLAIEDGEIVYGDERTARTIEGTIDNLGLSLIPRQSTDQPAEGGFVNHRLEAAFSGSSLVVDGRQMANIAAEVSADLTDEGATVERFRLTSPAGTATLSGRLTDWRALEYEFDAGLNVNVGTIADLLDPNAGIGGRADVQGKLAGRGSSYTFEGDLSGDDLFAAGFRADALRANVERLEGDGDAYDFRGDVTAGRLAAKGVEASDLRFAGRVKGEGADADVSGNATAGSLRGDGFGASGVRFSGNIAARGDRTEIDGDFAANRVEAGGAEVAGVTFKGEGEIANGEAALVGLATVDRVTGPDGLDADDIRFQGRFGTAGGGTAAGDVTLANLTTRAVRVGGVRGRVTAASGRVEVNDLTASVYDGTVRGRAVLDLRGRGPSSLEASFDGVDLDRALGAASPDAPNVNGRASGRVDLRWPGMNLRAARGTVRADIDGTVPAEGGALPIDGEVALTAVPGGFRIDRATLASDGSSVEATGTIGWDRRADLRVTASAPEASNLTALMSAINPEVARQIADNGVALGGEFIFTGTVTGPVTDPEVRGDVTVGSLAYGGSALGRFTAALERTAGGFRLSGGRIVSPAGGEIVFDVNLPASTDARQTITARLDRVDVAPFVGAFGATGEAFSGVASGTLNLDVRGGTESFIARLGKPDTTGSIDVSVANASIRGERVEDLDVRASFGGGLVTLENVRIASPRGEISLSGVASLRENTYRLDARGANVDLDLFELLAGRDLGLAGRADVTATIAGVKDGPVTEMTANVTGRDIVINGQRIENAQIAVVTEGTKATIRATGTALGEPRELVATVDLADDTLPYAATLELNGTDFITIARLIPGVTIPEGVTGRATGRVEVRGALLGDADLASTLSLNGSLTELAVTVTVDNTGRQYTLANRGDVVFSTAPGVLNFERATFVGEGTEITVEGRYAFAGANTSDLQLAGDINLAFLTSLTEDAYAAGVATLRADIRGPAGDPRFGGYADLRDASLRMIEFPLSFYSGNGRVRFNENQAQIESFTALSGGGRVRVAGGALFAGLRPSRWRFELDAQQVRATYPQDVRSIIDGALVLQGNPDLQVLSGVVNVRRAEYTEDVDLVDLAAIGSEGSLPRDPAGGPASPIRLDLRVEARDSIVIRNNLADVVASASLVLTGPINDPIVDGRATVTRGTLEFRQGEYRVTRGVVRFPGTQAGDITFDIQAEAEIRDYRVTIGLTGTPDRFYPTFRSDEGLTQAQIISLVLTGDISETDVGTTQALTQTSVGLLGSLVGEAVSRSVEKRTDRLFGINRFRIDPVLGTGADPTARVTIGRRLNRNLSILYSTNVTSTEEQVIQLEYRISDRVSVVAAREEDGSFGIDVRFRKRF